MAVVSKDISSGGDYTSISSWEAAANRNSDTDIWKGTCTDTTDHSAAVTFDSGGTPSLTSYLWLTSDAYCYTPDAGNRGGQYTGGSAQMFWVVDDYCRIEKLDLSATTIDSTNRLIFVQGSQNFLLSRCLIWNADATVNGGIGIHCDDDSNTLHIDNCAIFGWGHNGASSNDFSFGATQNWNFDHNTIVDNGDTAGAYDGNFGAETWNATVLNVQMYNNNWVGTAASDEINSNSTGASTTELTGSHNAYTSSAEIGAGWTDSATNWVSVTNGNVTGTKASGSWISFVSYDTGNVPDTMDITLVAGAGNVAVDGGTDRQGSEPDSRQDFSLDIGGNPRGTAKVDIGASQISEDLSIPVLFHHYRQQMVGA